MSARRGSVSALCFALLCAHAGAQQAAQGRPSSSFVVRENFVSVQVNVDGNGDNVLGDAANEPSIAVSPSTPLKLAIGWRQFDDVGSIFRQAGRTFSVDGGVSWVTPAPLEPGIGYTDPVLGYDSNGRYYYIALTNQGGFPHCNVFRSISGGSSWSTPVLAAGGDKPWLAVDRSGGLGDGNLYMSWDSAAGCCGSDAFARSTDGGSSWTSQAFPGVDPVLGTLDVGPDGTLFVGGVDTNDFSAFQVRSSSDALDPGLSPSFGAPVAVDMQGSLVVGAPGPNPTGVYGQFWVVADPGDATRVYALASVDPPGPDPMDVHFVRSEDGGLSWSAPVRVNGDPAGRDAWQWFGTLSVAPNGRLDAAWHDTRNAAGFVQFSETFHASSLDGGLTWSQNTAVTPSWNSHLGWPIGQKIGDYMHAVSDDQAMHLAYAATFNGEQDVYYLRIQP